MNIHKSRFAAILSVALMVCMMVTMLVVPASAATYSMRLAGIDAIDYVTLHEFICGCAEPDYKAWVDLGSLMACVDDSGHLYFLPELSGLEYTGCYLKNGLAVLYCEELGTHAVKLPFDCERYYLDDETAYVFTSAIDDTDVGIGMTDVVTPELFNTVLDEIVALLPVVIPVMIGFIGLRKGISFLLNVLHSA